MFRHAITLAASLFSATPVLDTTLPRPPLDFRIPCPTQEVLVDGFAYGNPDYTMQVDERDTEYLNRLLRSNPLTCQWTGFSMIVGRCSGFRVFKEEPAMLTGRLTYPGVGAVYGVVVELNFASGRRMVGVSVTADKLYCPNGEPVFPQTTPQ